MLSLSTCETVDVTSAAPGAPYHHGRLREALIDAAVGLARDSGPDAVVLRAVSREVGVSHNAAYRHFADLDELLSEVSRRAQTDMAKEIERNLGDAPADGTARAAWKRLDQTGRAYVSFAFTEPGLFRSAFTAAQDVTDATRGATGVGDSGYTAYELVSQCMDDLVSAGAMPSERRPLAEITVCCAVHGFSMLVLDGYLRGVPVATREQMLTTMLATLARGL